MFFAKMLNKEVEADLIRGLCPRFVPGGVLCLQYVDDTLLFLEADMTVAFNMKWGMTYFEQISGMRIKYHKSELIPINLSVEECAQFVDILHCVVGDFPIKYLGIPLHYVKGQGCRLEGGE